MRRNLQREHLARLCRMVLGNRPSPYGDMYSFIVFMGGSRTPPADAKSLARLHLQRIADKIDKGLGSGIDDTTKAHLVECRERIKKVLEANYTANEF
jgi:hypothetical protein